MILDGFIARIVAEFVKVQEIGVTLDQFIDAQVAAHPELADEAGVLKAAIAAAVDAGTFIPTITGALTGALAAIRAGHGEPGKHSAHA